MQETLAQIEQLINSGLYPDARRALRRITRVKTDRRTGMQVQLLLGKSYVSEGKWKESLQILHPLATAAGGSGEYETAAYAHHYTGDSYIYKGDPGTAAKQYRRSLDICEKSGISGPLLAMNISALALINRLEGRYGDALTGWERAVGIYESLSEKSHEADALINCAMLRSFLGEGDAAIRDARKAHSLVRKLGSKPRIVDCLWLTGILLVLSRREFSEGFTRLDQAVQESGGVGGLEVYRAYSTYADALTGVGAFDDAREYSKQALSVAQKLGYALGVAQCHLLLARIRRYEDDYVASHHYAREARSLFKKMAFRTGIARALLCESEVHIHNRQFSQAGSALDKALAIAEGTDDIVLKSDCAVTKLLLLLGQNRSAREIADELESFARMLKGSRWDQHLKVSYYLAILMLLEGESDRVSAIVREMLDEIQSITGMLPAKYTAQFLRHPIPRGVMELSMRVGLARALRELAPEEAIGAVSAFRDLTSKPHRKRAGARKAKSTPFELVYESSQMREVVETAGQIAGSEIPVLIVGDTGVGKEMLARYVHQLSGRKGQFVPLNCAAVPASLMESELFGYVRGAFTGADHDKKGLFLVADGGTLFLDEIGNMPAQMQAKLLRALEENSLRPLGATAERSVNVRLLSATNRDLKEDVESGRFREDLYYRINVVTVKLPPLRERTDDIPVLAEHFLKASGGQVKIEEGTLEAMARYPWPGNVRELKNEISRLVSLCEDTIMKSMLKEEILRPAMRTSTGGSLQEMERKMIENVLKETDYNKQKAAKFLGISRTTLYRKMKRHKITCAEP